MGTELDATRRLATGRAVEHPPDCEIRALFDELMLHSGGDEQQVASLECVTLLVMKQHAATADDHVNLVLRVRRLLFRSDRNG